MLKELQFNISRHVLVPKHEIMDDEGNRNYIEYLSVEKESITYIVENGSNDQIFGCESRRYSENNTKRALAQERRYYTDIVYNKICLLN